MRKKRQLETLLSSSLNGEATHCYESSKYQRPRSIDGRIRVYSSSVHCDNGSAQTRESVEERRNASPCASVGGREDLRGICIQYAVHNVYFEVSIPITFTIDLVDGE